MKPQDSTYWETTMNFPSIGVYNDMDIGCEHLANDVQKQMWQS